MTIKSALRSKLSRVSWSTIIALSLCFAGSAPAFGVEAECEHDNPNPQLYEADSEPFGRSMLRWSEDFWRWIYSVPAAQNPNITPGVDLNNGQHGPVFFLPTS